MEFSRDPVEATVSFDIFDHQILNMKLQHSRYSKVACYTGEDSIVTSWCVVKSNGRVADYIENLYFTFPINEEDTAKTDTEYEVNHPKHYTGHKTDVECIMFTELLPSLAANAFKYVWRCDDKGNKTEDLEKARWYLDRAYEIDCAGTDLSQKIKHIMLGIIDSSDFDEWHKGVLSKIINGYYASAYDDISDIIGKPKFRETHAEW